MYQTSECSLLLHKENNNWMCVIYTGKSKHTLSGFVFPNVQKISSGDGRKKKVNKLLQSTYAWRKTN